MYVEAICPLCFASHVVPDEMRGETFRCEECEEEFVISKKAKRTSKKPSRLRTVQAAEDEIEEVAPVESAEVLPEANLVDKAPKKQKPRDEEEEVLEIPDDAVQKDGPVVKTTPATKRRRGEDEEEDRPKKRRRDADDDEDDDRPRKRQVRRSGAPVGLIVGISAGAVFLFGLVGIGAWWALSEKEIEKPPQAQGNNPPPNLGHPKPGENLPPPRKDPPKKDPPKVDPPRVDPPKADPPTLWTAKADPLPAAVKMPAAFKKEIAAPGQLPEVVFPAGPSPFVAIGSNHGPGDERQVWNLQTGEMTGKVVGQIVSAQHPVLSPDGAHLAYLPSGKRSTVEIWAAASGQSATAQVGLGLTPELLEFAGSDKLLFGRRAGNSLNVKVIEAATGREEREFQTARPFGGRDALAVSPDGAYLALVEPQTLNVYDVKTGALVGQRSLTRANALAPGTCHGLSFSPDGTELAGLFIGGNGTQLICWDMIKGNVVSENTVPKAQPEPGKLIAYRGHSIDWVGDRRGWLLFGYTLVDRDKNGSATFLPEPAAVGTPVPRHLVGPGHLVTLQPTTKVLTVSLFDPDKPQ